jgi:hypothetical protein
MSNYANNAVLRGRRKPSFPPELSRHSNPLAHSRELYGLWLRFPLLAI